MVKAKKFGALSGVFTPSILTILGVIMYLRLPWIVGQAGLWSTIGIILVAHIISFTTSLSVSSIATDKKVETGGSYYIISRSLGLPIGGTLGLALFVGLSFSVSLYLIGFAEITLGYFGFEVTLHNIRIAGALALLALTILTFISTSLAIKSQYVILVALVLSLVSVFFGSHDFDPNRPLIAPMQGALPWITLFAIFFPAVTGFEAGVSMSGDLKDPRKNIPAGTIGAVLVGLVVYIGLALFLSHTVERDLLAHDPSVLFQIAWIPQLVIAGIIAATISSALGSILGAPRILQATAIDKITPGVLGKGFGASNEPRNALVFTFIIALSGILIGELNVIARIVTIFFIITYGFLNITYAIESWAGTDFRPSFKIPGFISIIGAVACIIVMIQLDVVAMIGASLILIGIFLFLKRRELTLQTGDTWNSVWASLVKTGLRKLTERKLVTRNWRPNVIIFSGGTRHRPYLIDMGKSLVGKLGIFTNFELVESKDEKTLFSKNQQIIAENDNGGKGIFTRRHLCKDIYEGIETIAKVYGFSGFEPNTILMGWARNSKNPESFSKLIKSFKKLDYNTIFLNYDKEFGFGKKKRIDIWWNGSGRNISFALALIRFLTSSNDWRLAKVRILVINRHTELTDKYHELIQQTLDNNRIEAKIKVINNSVEQLPDAEIIHAESVDTDLSILELNEKDENFIEKNTNIVEGIKTAMIIQSSGSFDEITVVKDKQEDKIPTPIETEEPNFEITGKLQLASKEIIANEVFQMGHKFETFTRKYYEDSYALILSKSSLYQKELLPLVEKTTEQLYATTLLDDSNERRKEFLKILNDFSYKAQRLLKALKQDVLVYEKQCLQNSTLTFFENIEKYLLEIPPRIRIKYHWKEFKQLRADSIGTGFFKGWKVFKSRITKKPAVYKIKVDRAARYYLYHKRIVTTQYLLQEFFLYTFTNIIEIRKILANLYEVIEKGKSGSKENEKLKNIIQMEKDRFKASVLLLEDKNRQFYYSQGVKMAEELENDLQQFNNILDLPGANFLSKPFPEVYKNDDKLVEEISGFPDLWHRNINLFVNKVFLDFLLLSLKNRIESKIHKYRLDLNTLLIPSLITPIHELQKGLEIYEQTGAFEKNPDRSKFKTVDIDEFYNKLYEEITGLFAELPVVLSISGQDLSHNLENQKLVPAHEILVSVRKTVEFSVGSELIDYTKKQAMDATIEISRCVSSIKDIIRLINFNLLDEAEDDPHQPNKEKRTQARDFINKLKQEEHKINHIVTGLSTSVILGLKNAFAPLSAGIIVNTSGAIEKKIRVAESQKIINRLVRWNKGFFHGIQKSLVDLVYSKSESILWVGRFEKPAAQNDFSNEEVYRLLDKYAPKQERINQLPFYYAKLFSGQSGIGEDFWVGMEAETARANQAIQRYKSTRSGFLLISGERNSGKTSLSKYVARQNFAAEEIFNIRAPMECTASVEEFEHKLLKSLKTNREDIAAALQDLQNPCVFIINDLELWWERKTQGTQVIEKLLFLIKEYSHKALFIINLNSHSLKLIHKLTNLQSWAMGSIYCGGFDARQIQEIIMLRHQAGGMKFILGNRHESEMRAWDFARLFNHFFDLSKGNIGTSIILWLASIKKVSGRILILEKPPVADLSFLDKLSREQNFYLLQYVYHLRCSVSKLAVILQMDQETLEKQILHLWHSGILVEKFPGIYAINPSLQLYVVGKLKEMKLL